MAKFDFNKYSDLQKLKDEMNAILESRMEKVELGTVLEGLSEQPFGAIKNVFESLSDKLYESAEGKKLIAKYVKAIREGKNTSNAYSVYEFVYHSPNVENTEKFLNEAISITGGINRKAFAEEKKKVAGVVAEAVSFVGKQAKEVKAEIEKNRSLNESIDYLMVNKKNFKNLPEYVNNFTSVENFLKENMREKPNEHSKKTGKELVASLCEALVGLEDWQKKVIEEITLAKLAKGDMSLLFEGKKNACLEKIDETMSTEKSVETKSHLENMRKQLSEKKYSEDSLLEDILTLEELNRTLSE